MNAELLAIGTELLLGEITDTNSAHIARALRAIGLDLLHISQVGDNEERIARALQLGLSRSEVIITTGGLGPTVDDVTREAVAQAAGRELVLAPDLLAQVEARFARWGRKMTENNRRQAMIPAGAIPLENPVGTAPAFITEVGGKAIVSLPGVPKEMEYLLEKSVVPYLRQKYNLTGVIKARVLKTAGLGESMVDAKIGDLEKLSNPTVGLAAHPASVDVRITAKADSEAEADRMIAEVETQVRERLGESVFGADGDKVESVTLKLLAERGLTLAAAEAGTGGALSARLSAVGAGNFGGGSLSPSRAALAAQLHVSADGMALAETAAQAAAAIRVSQASDLGLACLIERSDGGVKVGIGLSSASREVSQELGFGGHPDLLPQWAATIAIDRLRRWISRGLDDI